MLVVINHLASTIYPSGGAKLNCVKERGLVQSYVDGELDEHHVLEIQQHLDRCEECRSVHISEFMLRSFFSNKSLYQYAPEDLEKRIRLSLQKRHRDKNY